MKFSEWAEKHVDGQLDQEATKALDEVMEAVLATQKGGSMTVTLQIAPSGAGRALVKHKVAAKRPEFDVEAATYFLDPEGGLTRENPAWPKLPVFERPAGAVDAETGEIKES